MKNIILVKWNEIKQTAELEKFNSSWPKQVIEKYRFLIRLNETVKQQGLLKNVKNEWNKISFKKDDLKVVKGVIKANIVLIYQKYPYLKEAEVAFICNCSLRYVEKIMHILRINNFFSSIKRKGRSFVRVLNTRIKNFFFSLNKWFINSLKNWIGCVSLEFNSLKKNVNNESQSFFKQSKQEQIINQDDYLTEEQKKSLENFFGM